MTHSFIVTVKWSIPKGDIMCRVLNVTGVQGPGREKRD